jgi:hypothetical protein
MTLPTRISSLANDASKDAIGFVPFAIYRSFLLEKKMVSAIMQISYLS